MLGATDVIAGALHDCNSAVTNVSDVTRRRLSDDSTTLLFGASTD